MYIVYIIIILFKCERTTLSEVMKVLSAANMGIDKKIRDLFTNLIQYFIINNKDLLWFYILDESLKVLEFSQESEIFLIELRIIFVLFFLV